MRRGLAVRVTPRAAANEIVGVRDGVALIRVTAAPEDGRANAAVCALVAKRLGVPRSSVELLRGARSREKILRVEGLDGDAALQALAAAREPGRPPTE